MAQRPAVSRLAVLVDSGIIIVKEVIDYFPLGIVVTATFPCCRTRGADPISFAILEGHAKTGVSLMLIDAGMDTRQTAHLPHAPYCTGCHYAVPTEELITHPISCCKEYLPAYAAGSLRPQNQPHPDRATHTRKLTKADSILDTSKSARVRSAKSAPLDWPRSRTRLGQTDVSHAAAHVAAPDETVAAATNSRWHFGDRPADSGRSQK